MVKFIGREYELEVLNELARKKTSSLVVIKGRRRIGKSALAKEFCKDKLFLSFSGIPPEEKITAQMQRDIFAKSLSEAMGMSSITSTDWTDLFTILARLVQDKPYVILFDEISWMGSSDPTFLGKLKNAWDTLLSQNPGLILILCGSVSTWIEKNIIKSTGFFGRISSIITLGELSLKESNEFLERQGFKASKLEKFKLLSVLGGVPWYLEHINGKLTADENIKKLLFRPEGALFNEFNLIFNDLFGSEGITYRKIIEALTNSNADFNELCKKVGYVKSGTFSSYLDNLCQAGFVARDYTWLPKTRKVSRLSHFRLNDNYIRFYIKYVSQHTDKILSGRMRDISLSSLPEWNSVMGLQFENLVLKNRKTIQNLLGIRSGDIEIDNPFFQKKTSKHKGCQIDYMIQTRFNNLFVCEVKFSKNPIRADVIDQMKEKLSNLATPQNFAKLPVLIHISGIEDSVQDSAYFTEIIDFGQMIE